MRPGVYFHRHETEFVIHSTQKQLWLMLFDNVADEAPAQKIKLTRSGKLFHTKVPNVIDGTPYLYLTANGRWILDPYARAVHSPRSWGESFGLKKGRYPAPGKYFPKGIVIHNEFNWERTPRPRTPLRDTIIYEAHLRGFTQNQAGGTYLDFIKKIPYLQELGVTAVEFLPLFEFNELEYFMEGGPRSELLNFWGYSTRSFFAPMSRYASSDKPGAAVHEFKTLVKALHQAGIEVILDVVFNHTAEGDRNGPTYHFRALDEKAYYIQNKDGTNQNWSGCGNTFNANHPVSRKFIVDCLRYWAKEMQVDGFRFDLATSLCRGENGQLLEHPPLIRAIETEPALRHVKLIAEAWDCGGYQVGHFPGRRFADWNGRFRDDVRQFWNEGGSVGSLATRLAGSSDLYEHHNGSPLKSINFITAHDGFTLADLVSYSHKHNEANCEENRDGENHNRNTNLGEEGDTQNPHILARRMQQQKNLMATLLLSQGIPMITAGDEFGRTQLGNNNAYCQDNEISWIDWSLLETNKDLFEFTKSLIALRNEHPEVGRTTFFHGRGDVEWIGAFGNAIDWVHERALGMHLPGKNPLLVLINNEDYPVEFTLPTGKWNLELATADLDKKAVAPHSIAIFSRKGRLLKHPKPEPKRLLRKGPSRPGKIRGRNALTHRSKPHCDNARPAR
jgi:glycogen operon protein